MTRWSIRREAKAEQLEYTGQLVLSHVTEDKLTHDERLRLECLAQAVALGVLKLARFDPEVMVEDAAMFEKYVREGQA